MGHRIKAAKNKMTADEETYWRHKAFSQAEAENRALSKNLRIYTLMTFALMCFCGYIFVVYPSVYSESFSDALEIRLAAPDENMTALAQNLTKNTYGIEAADILAKWVYENVDYVETGNFRSAQDVFYSGKGVCRDKSMLLVSLLSAKSDSAVVSSVDHAQHAIVKVYYSSDGEYFYCDPTNGSPYATYCWDYEDCGVGEWCDIENNACVSSKSLAFCWYPV